MARTKNYTEVITLSTDGNSVKVNLRPSTKAKNIALRINHLKEIELVLPKGVPSDYAKKFLLQKQSWLFKKLKSIKEPMELKASGQIAIFGIGHKIDHTVSDNVTSTSIESGTIKISCPVDCIKDTIAEFLKGLFLKEITKMTKTIAKKQGLSFNKISVKDNVSRWGSCSSDKNLSFNWRLVFAPKEIVKYVVIHELCHLKEMNHSSNFWELVESIESDYLMARLWLKKNKAVIHSYLR
jgi:predicted metal-dependent hydrolase